MVFQPENNNEMDGIEVKSMPNFIPPEAAKEVQPNAPQPASEPPAPEVASTVSPDTQEPPVAIAEAEPVQQAEDVSGGEAPAQSSASATPGVTLQEGKPGDGMRLDKPAAPPEKAPLDEELDAERSNLSQVLSQAAAAVLAERQQHAVAGQRPAPAAAPQGPGSMVQQPAQPAGAFEAIASGVNSMVSNTVGAAAGAVRGVVSGVASALSPNDKSAGVPAGTGGVLVLPRLSEYRVDQVVRAADSYEEAHQKFWQADKMPLLRKEIEERARQSGISVEDVMGKMKPGGEFSELHAKFNTALAESPAAQDSKKAMNKALDGFVKQYGRAQEELLNPETENSPHYKGLKGRLGQSLSRMSENASGMPVAEGEDMSHLDKLRDAMAKIAEKLKEIVRDFVNAIRGGGKEANHAPSP